MTTNKKQLLTVKELAEVLRVHTQTIYEWMVNGKIPYIKLGRAVRFDPEAINQWLSEEGESNQNTARVEEEGLFTVKELAAYLKVSTQVIYDLLKRGELSYIKLSPRRFRIHHDAVKEWLERAA